MISILCIASMQDIYNYVYVPETNHVSMVFSVAAVLYLQFALHVMLFEPCNMFCGGKRCRSWLRHYVTSWRSRVRFPMVSLEFFIEIILPVAVWL